MKWLLSNQTPEGTLVVDASVGGRTAVLTVPHGSHCLLHMIIVSYMWTTSRLPLASHHYLATTG